MLSIESFYCLPCWEVGSAKVKKKPFAKQREFQWRLADALRPHERKSLAMKSGISEATISRLVTGSDWREPGVLTVKALAEATGTTVAKLLGEDAPEPNLYDTREEYRALIDALERLTTDDREHIISHAERFARMAGAFDARFENVVDFKASRPTKRGRKSQAADDFPMPPIPLEDWIEKDSDAPRPLHAWVAPVAAEAAAGRPRMPDDLLIPSAQILNSLREVRDDRVKVIKIFGDSMHPTLRNGWKVLMDPSRSLFQPGRIVIVYLKDEGTTIGLLAKEGDAFKIVKRNPDYGGPLEIPLPAGEWYPVGTITTIVEAPVEIE